MSDISMCSNTKCPKRNTCYRFIATPDPCRQSYAQFDEKECTHYMECKSKGQKKRLDVQCEG